MSMNSEARKDALPWQNFCVLRMRKGTDRQISAAAVSEPFAQAAYGPDW